MNITSTRRLVLPALGLAGALTLAACGGGGTAGSAPASSQQGSDHDAGSGNHGSGDTKSAEAEANDADLAFLTGMVPHHAQAVEMSEIVLAADPPAEIATIARQIKDAQDPEIAEMNAMLEALGEEPVGDHGGGHDGGHGGMMSEQEMAALEGATGAEAARLYLEGMIKHHEGAIEASDAQLADGTYEPARALARTIKTAQEAEIVRMRQLLQDL